MLEYFPIRFESVVVVLEYFPIRFESVVVVLEYPLAGTQVFLELGVCLEILAGIEIIVVEFLVVVVAIAKFVWLDIDSLANPLRTRFHEEKIEKNHQ